MRTQKRIVACALAGLMLLGAALPSAPAEQAKPVRDNSKSVEKASMVVTYVPPRRGAPGGRIGGGTRGLGRGILVSSVLAPAHTGLTTRAQPCLFWFVSGETSLPVELTLIAPDAVAPLLETRLASPIQPGVHRVCLADFGVRLSSGVAYQWSVSGVFDADRRSRDILASGTIERIDTSKDLSAKLASANERGLVAAYAEAGLWYDALEAASDLIDGSPGDASAHAYRGALLEQVGLPDIDH